MDRRFDRALGISLAGTLGFFVVTTAATQRAEAKTYQLKTLAIFNGTNGNLPRSGLIADSNGNLYGTTNQGGAFDSGTVFEIAAGSHTLTDIASFNGPNGAGPYGGLVFDNQGNLYGTTLEGGNSGDGNVYEIKKGSGTITNIAYFNNTNGELPESNLIFDKYLNRFSFHLA